MWIQSRKKTAIAKMILLWRYLLPTISLFLFFQIHQANFTLVDFKFVWIIKKITKTKWIAKREHQIVNSECYEEKNAHQRTIRLMIRTYKIKIERANFAIHRKIHCQNWINGNRKKSETLLQTNRFPFHSAFFISSHFC